MVAKGNGNPKLEMVRFVSSYGRVRGVATAGISGGWPISQRTRQRFCSHCSRGMFGERIRALAIKKLHYRYRRGHVMLIRGENQVNSKRMKRI
jgi:hypothetical protein